MKRLALWLEAPRAQNWLVALILANAAILGLGTFPAHDTRWGAPPGLADRTGSSPMQDSLLRNYLNGKDFAA